MIFWGGLEGVLGLRFFGLGGEGGGGGARI